MAVAAFTIAFLAVGIGVLFVAYSGGPGAARQAYLTGGRRGFRIAIVLLYVAFGIAVPALVISDRQEGKGATGTLANAKADERLEQGKELFRQNCWACHQLRAIESAGVTGPNLDEIGALNERRVLEAIENGGTGQGRMPARLLEGDGARAVAYYLSQVAGK